MSYGVQNGFGPIATPPAPWDSSWGTLRGGRVVMASNISTSSTSATSTGLSCSVDLVGGRLYRVHATMPQVYCTAFPGTFTFSTEIIDETATIIRYLHVEQFVATNGHTSASGWAEHEATTSARKTFTLAWHVSSGSATVAADAASFPLVMTVEDIGPADKILRGIQ